MHGDAFKLYTCLYLHKDIMSLIIEITATGIPEDTPGAKR